MQATLGVYLNHASKQYAIFCRDLRPQVNSNFRQDATGDWFDARWPSKKFKDMGTFAKRRAEHMAFALGVFYETDGYTKVTVKHDAGFFQPNDQEIVV